MRDYFCAYHSFIESLSPLSDAECGRLFRACLEYSKSGEIQELRGNERFVWPGMKKQIDEDKKAYETKCEKLRANASKCKQLQANATNCFSREEKDGEEKKKAISSPSHSPISVKEIREEGEREEQEKNNKKKTPPPRFQPPTVEEVRAYCTERGSSVNPEAFVDFYTSKGWKVGQNPMKDWKAAVRTWERSEYGRDKKPSQIVGTGKVDLKDVLSFMKRTE